MFGTELYLSLVIGVVVSLIYAERTGVIPAGLVVPATSPSCSTRCCS